MKTIGIVTGSGSGIEDFKKLNIVDTIRIEEFPLNEMVILVNKNQSIISARNISIDECSILLIRGVLNHLPELEIILNHCYSVGIPVIDSGLMKPGIRTGSKVLQYLLLKEVNLPILETMFIHRLNQEMNFSFPLVAKPVTGRKGNGVSLIQDKKSLEDHLNLHTFIAIQKFVPNDGDYRILVLGDRILGSIKRIAKKGDFRSNIALGAQAISVTLDDKIQKLAIQAARACGFEFAGVDMVMDSTSGEWSIIEVNRAPEYKGFVKATGINVTEKIVEYLFSKITADK